MELLNPWGLLALLTVPLFIALYLLKQKHKEVRVPSLLLWNKTKNLMEARSPWQKLRKNLLFILQLLALLLLIFAFTRPVISGENIYDETIVIIDSSASMQSEDMDGQTRFEYSLGKTREMAEKMQNGNAMSLILAGETVTPVFSHCENVLEMKRMIQDTVCSYGRSDMDNALLLASSLAESSGNAQIIIFTDGEIVFDKKPDNISVINVSSSKDNTAVTNIAGSYDRGYFNIMSTQETFYRDKTVTLELYCDGELKDARKVDLSVGKQETVYWSPVSENHKIVTVKIQDEDILPEDNELSLPLVKETVRKLLIVSDNSFFIEKIFGALGGFEVYKQTPATYTDKDGEGYDLIVFDGLVPDKMPQSSGIWILNPDRDFDTAKVGYSIKGAYMTCDNNNIASQIGEFIRFEDIAVARFREIEVKNDWTNVAYIGTYPGIMVKTTDDGTILAAFSFDLHDSNLPLLKDYPILMQNLISYTFPDIISGSGLYTTNMPVSIRSTAYAKETVIVTPKGEEKKIAPPYPVRNYIPEEPGVYKLIETGERKIDGEVTEIKTELYLSVGIPKEESAMQNFPVSGEEIKNMTVSKGQTELWPYILIAIVLILMTEWWVYFREY